MTQGDRMNPRGRDLEDSAGAVGLNNKGTREQRRDFEPLINADFLAAKERKDRKKKKTAD